MKVSYLFNSAHSSPSLTSNQFLASSDDAFCIEQLVAETISAVYISQGPTLGADPQIGYNSCVQHS